MTPLQAVIVEILRARGFKVTEQDGYLVARSGTVRAAFCVMRKMERKDVDDFLESFSDFSGKKVLVAIDTLPSSVLENLDRSVMLWDRQALEQELDRMDGTIGGHGLVDELLSDDFPSLLSEEHLDSLQDRSVGERIVRPAVTAEAVMDMARDSIAGFQRQLQLMPYYVFDYLCPLYQDGELVGEESGTLSVNGLTQKVDPWPDGRELIYSMEEEHTRLDPFVTEQEAARAAIRELMRVHTFDREHVVEEDHATLTEKKRIAPREESIELDPQGIFFVPMWCIEGVHGLMVVDASTGRVVSEDHCPWDNGRGCQHWLDGQ
ncbi:MAG TPA: hypothetical protein PLI21_07890 [Methanomassiliicoccaceae archaeon]|jgi:hypothetical protein|nr:hypothetical protein [Euryarchaeota archaeon]HOB38271.1 hypothetical protein [Methanomassiliicoccaceae archaeon]HOK28929.1 hypothetical protein [Methanomassiliicoccaceae archaeon]HQA20712.1 hypothetical protein [Methanomassiliicoccaceae archaeon]HQD88089.1 hypothetical protein [Methanomassiliicoccaceae archaeon]